MVQETEFVPQTQIFQSQISLQPEGVNILYLKLRLFDLTDKKVIHGEKVIRIEFYHCLIVATYKNEYYL